MDELLQHCLRELAFDGNLGCDVSRLREFIEGFYNTKESQSDRQLVDGKFCSFVWTMMVNRPDIRVGTVPEGSVAVYISPQKSQIKKSKKSKENDEDDPEEGNNVDDIKSQLRLIDDAEVSNYTLDQLKTKYGDALRVAVDHDTSFVAITGSHVRPPKLSGQAYTCLQLISRSRLDGISMNDLSKTTGYDPKMCFYLVRNLVELGLVLKIPSRKERNICIHKYFWERNSVYKNITVEEQKLEHQEETFTVQRDDAEMPSGDEPTAEKPNFDPIDARHLSSDALIRGRLVQLLMASANYTHTLKNILLAIGFANPTRKERRYMLRHTDQAVADGVVERVHVPHKFIPGKKTLCLRLLSGDPSDRTPNPSRNDQITSEELGGNESEDEEGPDFENQPVANLTIPRQMVSLLEEAGKTGVTLNELTLRLGNYDRRTLERLLFLSEKEQPPPNLADLGCASIMENFGRERRHRYYTVSSYRELFVSEGLQDQTTQHMDIPFHHSGNHMSFHESEFYDGGLEALGRFTDGKRSGAPSSNKKRAVNPVLPDGSIKKGRPRKEKVVETIIPLTGASEGRPRGKRGTKRKAPEAEIEVEVEHNLRTEVDQQDSSPHPSSSKKPPRRSNKRAKLDVDVGEVNPPAQEAPTTASHDPEEVKIPQKRKYSRKRNKEASEVISAEHEISIVESLDEGALDESASGPVESVLNSTHRVPLGLNDSEPIVSSLENQATIAPPHPLQISETNVTLPIPTSLEAPVAVVEKRALSEPRDRSVERRKRARVAPPSLRSMPSEMESNPEQHDNIASSENMDPTSANNNPENASPNVASTSASSVSKKPTKTTAQSLSNLRLQNEILSTLKSTGGISHHWKLRQDLSSKSMAGPSGAGIDSRTLERCLKTLESRGDIKLSQVAVRPVGSAQRSACVVRLPEVSQESLAEYIPTLDTYFKKEPAPNLHIKEITEPMEYDGVQTRVAPRRQAPRVEGPMETEEQWRAMILSDTRTVAQLYGFLSGIFMRARELHLYLVNHLLHGQPSEYFLSLDDRIVTSPYFTNDISVGTYCSIISIPYYDEELEAFLRVPGNVAMVCSTVPPRLREILELSRASGENKIFKLLQLLSILELISPLRLAHSSSSKASSDSASTKFDVVTDLSRMPKYWKVNQRAPLFDFSRNYELPFFLEEVSLSSLEECLIYWNKLQELSIRDSVGLGQPLQRPDHPFNGPLEFIRSVRRASCWVSDYELSSTQRRYLESLVDPTSGATPLQDPTPDRFDKACYVTAAPSSVVHQYLHHKGENVARTLEKIRRRKVEAEKVALERARKVLAEKAAEVRERLEQDWTAIVSRVYDGDVPPENRALRKLHDAFITSKGTLTSEILNQAIQKALAEPQAPTGRTKVPVLAKRLGPAKPSHHVVTETNKEGENADELVAGQGAKEPSRSKGKGKSKSKDKASSQYDRAPGTRRSRFWWTAEYDELARDAAAIIRARCRSHRNRMDWTALQQIFPSIDRNAVRQRIAKYDATPVGGAYLRRLEDAWYEIWVADRGTEKLPDELPDSRNQFNLTAHIEYLRAHIDKTAIHTGSIPFQGGKRVKALPSRADLVRNRYRITEPERKPRWEFFYSLVGDEPREKFMRLEALVLEDDCAFVGDEAPKDVKFLAESAIKMALSTSEYDFDQNSAQILLQHLGEDCVRKALKSMQEKDIVSSVDRKTRPGKAFRYQEWYEKEAQGPISEKVFQEAAKFEDELEADEAEWKDWSLLAHDGQIAALTKLVSDKAVEVHIDTSVPVMVAARLSAGSSKKLDDDHIEGALSFRPQDVHRTNTGQPNTLSGLDTSGLVVSEGEVNLRVELETQLDRQHGITVDGVPATCRHNVHSGPVDCEACLWNSQTRALQKIDVSHHDGVFRLLALLCDAGPTGLDISNLVELSIDRSTSSVLRIFRQSDIPLCFSAGYTRSVVVASRFLQRWTVPVTAPTSAPTPTSTFAEGETMEDEPIDKPANRFVFPRRWIDVSGEIIKPLWNTGLRSVVGWVWQRPGISEWQLRGKLSNIYDRQEINDLLRHLYQIRTLTRLNFDGDEPGWTTEEEEKRIHWAVSDEGESWYMLGREI